MEVVTDVELENIPEPVTEANADVTGYSVGKLMIILHPESTGKGEVKDAIIVDNSSTVDTESDLEIAAVVIVAQLVT